MPCGALVQIFTAVDWSAHPESVLIWISVFKAAKVQGNHWNQEEILPTGPKSRALGCSLNSYFPMTGGPQFCIQWISLFLLSYAIIFKYNSIYNFTLPFQPNNIDEDVSFLLDFLPRIGNCKQAVKHTRRWSYSKQPCKAAHLLIHEALHLLIQIYMFWSILSITYLTEAHLDSTFHNKWTNPRDRSNTEMK